MHEKTPAPNRHVQDSEEQEKRMQEMQRLKELEEKVRELDEEVPQIFRELLKSYGIDGVEPAPKTPESQMLYREAVKALRAVTSLLHAFKIELPQSTLDQIDKLVTRPSLVLKLHELTHGTAGGYQPFITNQITVDPKYLSLETEENRVTLQHILRHEILHFLSSQPAFESDPDLGRVTGLERVFGRAFNEAITDLLAVLAGVKAGEPPNTKVGYPRLVVQFRQLIDELASLFDQPKYVFVRLFAQAYVRNDEDAIMRLFDKVGTHASPEQREKIRTLLKQLGVAYVFLEDLLEDLQE